MPCFLCLFSNNRYKTSQEPLQSLNDLKQLLFEYDLQLLPPREDLKSEGSFFFSLVSGVTFMLDQLKDTKEEYDAVLEELHHLGISPNAGSINENMKKLHQEICGEW